MGLIEQASRERQRPDPAGLGSRRDGTMVESDNLRYTKIAFNNGSGAIPAHGFGTLIPDPIVRGQDNCCEIGGFTSSGRRNVLYMIQILQGMARGNTDVQQLC